MTSGKLFAIIPLVAEICGCSSSGRAPPCQGGGSEFEPRQPLQNKKDTHMGVFFVLRLTQARARDFRLFPKIIGFDRRCTPNSCHGSFRAKPEFRAIPSLSPPTVRGLFCFAADGQRKVRIMSPNPTFVYLISKNDQPFGWSFCIQSSTTGILLLVRTFLLNL